MMETLIRAAVDKGAATLHIKAGDVFRARIKADLVKLSDEPLSDEDVLGLALTGLRRIPIMPPQGAWRLAPYAIGGLATFWTIQRLVSMLPLGA